MKVFPNFWFDSNAYFGRIESLDDLKLAFKENTSEYCSAKTFTEFLNLCKQHKDNESMNFGLRYEHSGIKSLLEFLVENGVELNA